ncbi:ATP synthase F0 subunit B [Candidatus Peregrinibacteria bacterium CG_4_9_14_0_2_um_filter_53_11]|nr:MAG: ATP synthase F0 subunit B [Candidatus Peregrinibacteria bacterium CG_4_9_14_0_2_um_filter_53_11]
MELLYKLGVDWKLLIAQVINFAILLFILGKFVYRPVLKMLETRTKTIEKGIHDAQESEKRLKEAEQTEREQIAEAHRKVGELLDTARSEAESLKKEIVDSARAQSEDMMQKTKVQLREEKEAMLGEARGELSELVLMATEKILKREFTQEDQKRLAEALSSEMKSVK